MTVRYTTYDPVTGEERVMHMYVRQGQTVLREVPKGLLHVEERSPAQLEQMAKFTDAAASSYGAEGIGPTGEPRAAVAVRNLTTADGPRLHDRVQPTRQRRQEELRALVGAAALGQMEAEVGQALPPVDRLRTEGRARFPALAAAEDATPSNRAELVRRLELRARGNGLGRLRAERLPPG